jgi:hypothetical protein
MKRRDGRGWALPALAAVLALLGLLGAVAWWWWPSAAAGAAAPTPAATATAAADAAVYRGIAGTVVRFADVEQARAVLGAEDAWMRRTSGWQRAVLMGRTSAPDLASFRAWQAAAAQPWPDEERRRWMRALETVGPAFVRLKLTLPPEVLLVRTNGSESANQPHTRANAVMLPAQIQQQGYTDVELLAHELFHVVSRHQPELANRLYDLIGYDRVGELDWPAGWLPLRIANQDAEHDRHLMRVRLRGGREATVMPVVVTSNPKLPPADGDTLLDLIDVRLLEVVPGAGTQPTRPVVQGAGQPAWHLPDAVADFATKLGGNTDYIQHPDETIADNLMFLVSGRPVKNPALLKRIEAVLQAYRP